MLVNIWSNKPNSASEQDFTVMQPGYILLYVVARQVGIYIYIYMVSKCLRPRSHFKFARLLMCARLIKRFNVELHLSCSLASPPHTQAEHVFTISWHWSYSGGKQIWKLAEEEESIWLSSCLINCSLNHVFFYQTRMFFLANSIYFVTSVANAWKPHCHFDNPVFTRLCCKNFVVLVQPSWSQDCKSNNYIFSIYGKSSIMKSYICTKTIRTLLIRLEERQIYNLSLKSVQNWVMYYIDRQQRVFIKMTND